MKGETWASANARRACLVCGVSDAYTIRLPDGRIVRACNECLRTPPWEDWSRGEFIGVQEYAMEGSDE